MKLSLSKHKKINKDNKIEHFDLKFQLKIKADKKAEFFLNV